MRADDRSAPVQNGHHQQQHDHDVFLDDFCEKMLPALLLSSSMTRQRNILPVKRVKTTMKQEVLQPNIHVSVEGAEVMAFSMQAFIRCVVAVAWRFTVARKRQTVQVQDLKAAVFAVQRFRFLLDFVHAYDNDCDPNGPAPQVIAPAPPFAAEVGGGADTGLEATREQ
jgi:histone H3/H4